MKKRKRKYKKKNFAQSFLKILSHILREDFTFSALLINSNDWQYFLKKNQMHLDLLSITLTELYVALSSNPRCTV